ncbi:MAG: hypothetical protein ABSA76_01160 [Bacteroidales bacterium]
MNKMEKTTGMVLMLFLAGTLALSAQQNMRDMRMDTTRMHWMMMNPGHRQMMMNTDSMPMHGMRRGMWPGMMQPGMRGMGPGRMMGDMWGGMNQRPIMRPGMGMWPHDMWMGSGMQGRMNPGRIIDNIPNLTDKQKKDIAVLRIDQQTEMKKFREEMQSKFKAIRETQRANIEKLLTPEQKKWLEENTPKSEVAQKTEAAPAKTK